MQSKKRPPSSRNKKILLIGGTGQLGQEILNLASEYNFDVWAPPSKEVNVVKEKDVERAISKWHPDILINTSASHVLPLCDRNPKEAFLMNSVAVYNMARLARDNGLRFVTFSSHYVFSGNKNRPMREDDPLCPLQIYGISKAAGEYAALAIYPEQSFIIRVSTLYGGLAGSRIKGGNFVLNIIKEAENKKSIRVAGDQITNPTYAVDAARATLVLLSTSGVHPGVYHLVSDDYCSYYDFTKEIFVLAGIKTGAERVRRGGFSAGVRRPIFAALANTRARAYGITLPSWKDGLKAYLKYLKNAANENKSKSK